MRLRFDTSLWDARYGLQHELALLGAEEIVISANVTLTKGGWLAPQQKWTQDSGATPLFPDADLNEMLSQALGEYASRVPKVARTTVAVAVNTTSISLPAVVTDYALVAVRDGAGNDVPVMSTRGVGS